MKNKHITGQLKLSASAMRDTSFDQYDVHAVIEAHKLGTLLCIDNRWYRGIIPAQALYGIPEEADIETVLSSDVVEISETLSNFLQTDIISKLGLTGEIIIKVEDSKANSTVMAKLIVKESHVSHQRASYTWSESMTL